MSKKAINKDIWINSYPILIWLMTEPLAGLVDSRIAGIIGTVSYTHLPMPPNREV